MAILKKCRIVPLVLALIVVPSGLQSQQLNQGRAATTIAITKGDSILSKGSLDPNEEVRIIVQFITQSLSRIKGMQNGVSPFELINARARIDDEHSKFSVEVQRLESEVRSQRNSSLQPSNSKTHYEYRNAINGVALTTRRWMMEAIGSFPYVKSVELDHRVEISDATSNHVIGVDSVWNQLGIRGEGILIGIIDTGIDYMHPDLGGGIGPTFKVVGGYDFVNHDSNPMDDHGHGTHVAGIAAANGASLKGVAPNAKLLAIKVIAQSGYGNVSDAIAGIEYALDPDGNPTTNDGVQVINMSIGDQYGSWNDAWAQATDGAALAGVVCVVAAGNSGPGYSTIGSPAAAPLAFTIGATDNNDNIASFSSRGPVLVAFTMKPDIMAPGVNINSTYYGGGYATLSGTSMASPHGAGAAALMRQLHPTWSPELIKAVLMQSARDLGASLWNQGTGRLNVLAATRKKSVTTPSSISYGFSDISLATFVRAETLHVRNVAGSGRTYSASYRSLPTGASIAFSPSLFAISSNDSTLVIATLTVNNSIVPDADAATHSYAGQIVFSSSTDTSIVPVSFVQYPHLIAKLTASTLVRGIAHDRLTIFRTFGPPDVDADGTWIGFLPRGTYDVMANFERFSPFPYRVSSFVVKENIQVPSAGVVNILEADAVSSLTINPIRADGGQADVRQCIEGGNLTHKVSGFGIRNGYGGLDYITSKKFSNISNSYVYDWHLFTFSGLRETYSYLGTFDDFSSSRTITNSANSFRRLSVKYQAIAGMPSNLYCLDFVGANPDPWSRLAEVGAGYGSTPIYLSTPFEQTWYLTRLPKKPFPEKSGLVNYTKVFQGGSSTYWDMLSSRLFYLLPNVQAIDQNTVQMFPFYFTNNPNLVFTGDTLKFGLGPTHWSGQFVNSSFIVDFRTNSPLGYRDVNYAGGQETYYPLLFASQFQDFSPKDLFYTLLRNNIPVGTGRVMDRVQFLSPDGIYLDVRYQIPVSQSDKYTIQIRDTSYSIQGQRGSALMSATFDLRNTDKNPPTLYSLNIARGNEFTDRLLTMDQGKVRFALSDASGLPNVRLFYHLQNDTTWIELSTTRDSSNYTSNIPSTLTVGFISLRILASDQSGNVMDYKAEPAFLFNQTPVVQANIRAFLQGPFAADSMTTILRLAGLIPQAQPYNVAPWNYTGLENVSSIPNNVVDWVLLELRADLSATTTAGRRAAFLKANGSIVDTNGTGAVTFSGVVPGRYYLIVRHRNHLPIMSAVTESLSVSGPVFDFTTAQSKAYGSAPMVQVGANAYALPGGDAQAVSISDVNGVFGSLNMTGYFVVDVNLSGIVTTSDAGIVFENLNKTSQVPP